MDQSILANYMAGDVQNASNSCIVSSCILKDSFRRAKHLDGDSIHVGEVHRFRLS